MRITWDRMLFFREARHLVVDKKRRLDKAHQCLVGLTACLALSTLGATPLLAARAMKPLEIKQRYNQVLGVLATGDLARALVELVEVEQAAVGDEQAWRYVDNLWRLKLHVIRGLLGSQDAELLMPIIVLHHDAYFRYAEMGRRYLAQHSRTMSTELAEIYAERSGTPAAGAFAGWTLTSLGAYLWSPSNIGPSADLFFRAVNVDPGNRLALRGLSAAYERNGEYEKAVETLERALAQEPGDPELELRLVLCHIRDTNEASERALAVLDLLTGPETPAWIRSVAYQELARVQAVGDDRSGAEATLREGLKALPGDQQLSIQLASILNSQRRRSEAIRVLDAIEIYGWERASARQVYDFWRPPDIDHLRAELREEMKEGLNALAMGVASAPVESAGP